MTAKHYATGNGGNGAAVYAFSSKKERDHFVAWTDSYDCRRSITRDEARRYGHTAIIFGGSDGPSQEVSV